ALEEALRTGRAPVAGGSGGSQTPPVVPPSSAPPRRGMAGGGGSGASSFASPDKGGAPEPERLATKSVEAEGSAATSAAAPHINGRTQAQPSPSYTAHDNSATARPAATPNLKLVPTAAQSGGAPSFAGGAAARASDAPFSLSDGAGLFEAQHPFVEGARAGEDRVGQPVALTPTKQAGTPVQATAASAPHAGAVTDEKAHAHSASDDPASAFKRGLEARGKLLLVVALDGARRVWVEDEEVRVEFTPEGKHLRDTLMKPENMRLLHEVCCEALGRGVGVAVRMRAPGEREDEQLTAEDESRREQRLMRERVEGHPVVQKMLKTFRAEIVEVRRTDDAPSPHHQ
ncbi:MAG: hypothetical protein QOJ70_3059, partial [Acidobacteriota bacterium]|nr:hypothetical protein [Acidobacteriota bacterium]